MQRSTMKVTWECFRLSILHYLSPAREASEYGKMGLAIGPWFRTAFDNGRIGPQ